MAMNGAGGHSQTDDRSGPEACQDLLDPRIDASFKGFPHESGPLHRSEIGRQGWNLLRGDLPLPLAVIKRDPLKHNLSWMRQFCGERGIDLAPHGKTTMSPQLFRQQLDAGAWGITFATVTQLYIGVRAGVRRCLIANQVFTDADLNGLESLRREYADLRVAFLVDSLAQLALIEAWHAKQGGVPAKFEVLLEIGVTGGRTGCREHAPAMELAAALGASRAVRLIGIECYEGLGASGSTERDAPYVQELMQRVAAVARECDQRALFDTGEVLITAGGSAIFDLVAQYLDPVLSKPVRGVLRSGCYVTHDHGSYQRMMNAWTRRIGCGDGLHAAMEVWACVQARPEPGLAILAVGKRDISHDLDMPIPISVCRRDQSAISAAPPDWKIVSLNDQHAYLRWSNAAADALQVGDRVALGISHPCTTFDKWRWIPIVDESYTVCDAILTYF